MRSRKFLALLPVFFLAVSCTRDPRVQAQRYIENGNKFFDKGKFKEASIMYRRALQRDLRFGEAYYRLGLTDLKLGAYGDASRNLRRAVELQPNNADAAVQLADLLFLAATQDNSHSGELRKDAEDLTEKLLAQDPNSFDGHRLKGELDLYAKNPAAAVTEFEKANAAKPYQSGLVMAYFQALVADNRFPEAEKLARDLIAKQKGFAPIYDLLYLQYGRLNRLNDAEDVLKLKVENNPKRSSYLVQLAGFYFLEKRRPEMDAAIKSLTNEKDHPDGHLLAGDFFFFRAREFDHAREQYEAAMAAFPKDKAFYQKRIVELLATTGKNNDANNLLAAILKDNPKDGDAIAMRAAMMLTTGDRNQVNAAVNDLQALVTKTPKNHILRFELGRALIAKGDIESARLQLEEAVNIRPDFMPARELLGRVYLAKNDPGRALKAADEMIGLQRNDLQAHLIRSSALLELGDKDKARQELDSITKTNPQNLEAQFQVGYLAYEDKDFKRAEQLFGGVYKANPADFRGLVGVTETLVSQNRLGDALKMMQAAADREPARRDLKLAVANLLVRAERYDDAIAIFHGLLDKEPKSADLLLRLGETQRLKGDLNLAIESFRRASQAAPNDVAPLLRLGLMMSGTGKTDQAKPIYEQILKLQPDQPVALNNLAYIKAEEGADLDQALTMAQRALQKQPNSADIADTLGWIYIKKNLSDDAIRVFRDLVQKDPDNAMFHYHYGMALLQKGDRPTAKRELETAIKDKPSKDDQAKIQELLQKI